MKEIELSNNGKIMNRDEEEYENPMDKYENSDEFKDWTWDDEDEEVADSMKTYFGGADFEETLDGMLNVMSVVEDFAEEKRKRKRMLKKITKKKRDSYRLPSGSVQNFVTCANDQVDDDLSNCYALGAYGAYKGYDAIFVPDGNYHSTNGFMAVLNRTKVIMSDRDIISYR